MAVLFRDGWLLRRVVGKVGCHRPHPQHRRKLPDTFDAQPQDKKFIMADLSTAALTQLVHDERATVPAGPTVPAASAVGGPVSRCVGDERASVTGRPPGVAVADVDTAAAAAASIDMTCIVTCSDGRV